MKRDRSPHPARSSPHLRLPEAAAYLRVAKRSLANRAWRIRMGIPALKIGRLVVFDRRALDRWLERQTEGGQP